MSFTFNPFTGKLDYFQAGTSPASPSGSIQYNNGGVFGGSSNATLDGSGNITANSFIKTGGTSSQFLKANGSVDSSTYLTSLAGAITGATDTTLTQTGSTLGLNLTNANTWTKTQTFQSTAVGTPTTIFKSLASQTAGLSQYQNSAGTALLDVTKSGGFKFTIDSTTPTTPTVALAGAGAGNVTNGTHIYAVVYLSADGEGLVSADSSSVNVTNNAVNGQVTVTIPVSSNPLVTGRRIYRSLANTGSYWYFKLADVNDNTSTTYTDNISDATMTTNGIRFPFYYYATDGRNAGSSLSGAIYSGTYKVAGVDSAGNFNFYDTNGNPAGGWFRAVAGTTGMYFSAVRVPNGGANTGSGQGIAKVYMGNDTSNTNSMAMYYGGPTGGGRIYIGDPTAPAYSLNLSGISRFESFPYSFAMAGYANPGAGTNPGYYDGGAGDAALVYNMIGGSGGTHGLILNSGSGTNGFLGLYNPQGQRTLKFNVDTTDGDQYHSTNRKTVVGQGGPAYGWIHDNRAFVYKTSFTGSGTNDAIVMYSTTSENSGTGHTYDVKITSTGSPDQFQVSVDGGAYGAGTNITGASQTITNGVRIKFNATTGHTLNDVTRFTSYYQTAPLMAWGLGNTGGGQALTASLGDAGAYTLMTLGMGGTLTQTPYGAGTTGQIIKGYSGQTADFVQWQNSAGTVLSSVDKNGAFNSAVTQTTVNGSTSGTIIWSTPFNGTSYKKVLIELNALTSTANVLTYITAFHQTPAIVSNTTGLAIATISNTSITIPVAAAASGWIILEGY